MRARVTIRVYVLLYTYCVGEFIIPLQTRLGSVHSDKPSHKRRPVCAGAKPPKADSQYIYALVFPRYEPEAPHGAVSHAAQVVPHSPPPRMRGPLNYN